MNRIVWILLPFLPALSAFSQTAATVEFGDQATWQYVSSNITSVSFTGLGGLGSDIDQYYPSGIQINGVSFYGGLYGPTPHYLYIRTTPNVMYGAPDGDLGCPPPQVPCGDSGSGITVSFPPGTTSIGLSLGSFWPPGPVTVRFTNGQSFVVPNAPLLQNFDTSTAFAGFVSTEAIDSVEIEAAGLPIIRALSFGTYLPSQPPFISASGIVPLDGSTNSVEPGEWISIFGVNLAGSAQSWTGAFTTTLGGTTLTIDGKPAYLSYVSPYQINAQVPDDSSRGTVSVVLKNSLGTATGSAKLADFAPSFSLLDSTHAAAIILRSDGSGAYGAGTYDIVGPTGTSLGYPTVAARAGDNVALFGVGFGPTSSSAPAGTVLNSPVLLQNSVLLVIGNSPVTVIAPNYAAMTSEGLYQFNFTVPSGLGSGDLPLLGIVSNNTTQTGVVISLGN